MNDTTTTSAATLAPVSTEGVMTLGQAYAEPVGWDGNGEVPQDYLDTCMRLAQDTLTRIGAEVVGVIDGVDIVFVEDDVPCIGHVGILPSFLIDTTREDLCEMLEDCAEAVPSMYLTGAVATHAILGVESVRCDLLSACLEPEQARLRVCHVRGVCVM